MAQAQSTPRYPPGPAPFDSGFFSFAPPRVEVSPPSCPDISDQTSSHQSQMPNSRQVYVEATGRSAPCLWACFLLQPAFLLPMFLHSCVHSANTKDTLALCQLCTARLNPAGGESQCQGLARPQHRDLKMEGLMESPTRYRMQRGWWGNQGDMDLSWSLEGWDCH